MKKTSQIIKKLGLIISLVLMFFSVNVYASEQNDFTAVIVTSQGGIEDGSFNQSAWEGLEEWGKENGLERGVKGYEFIQSNNESDYMTNLSAAHSSGFDLIYGLGYQLSSELELFAKQNPKQNFVIIDGEIDLANVTSITFKEEEGAYLAGIAAALTTKSKYIGFIGGENNHITRRYQAGFIAGVREIDPDIKIIYEYVGSFDNPALGRQLAGAMYSDGVDIIFHAAGSSGKGVFSEAKDIYMSDPDKKVWVIGCDRDQTLEGSIDYDGQVVNLTLTSVVKDLSNLVKDINTDAQTNGFQAQKNVYGLNSKLIDITKGQLSEENWQIVQDYQKKIIQGKIKIPINPSVN